MTNHKAEAEKWIRPTPSNYGGIYVRDPAEIATGQVHAILALAAAVEQLVNALRPIIAPDTQRTGQ